MASKWFGVWITLLGAASLSGCVGSHWQRTEIVSRNDDIVVEVVRRVDSGRVVDVGYAHPAGIDGRYLEACFRETRFRLPTLFKETEPQPVVDPKVARRLGDAVAEALRSCNSSQRVRFRAFNTEESVLFLPGTTVTQGVAFVQPRGVLNIAYELVGSVPDPEDPDPSPPWGDPTRWASSSARITPPSGASFFDDGGTERKLWLTFRLNGETPVARSEVDPEEPPAEKPKPPVEEKATPPDPKPVDPKPVPVEKPPTEAAKPPVETTKPLKKLTDAEILQRLRFLEELYEDGTITEEQYRKKRKELLELGNDGSGS